MKLLKVGESYLNLHNVAMFRDDGEVVTAYFHTEMSPISFEGEDGHNLRSWLKHHAEAALSSDTAEHPYGAFGD